MLWGFAHVWQMHDTNVIFGEQHTHACDTWWNLLYCNFTVFCLLCTEMHGYKEHSRHTGTYKKPIRWQNLETASQDSNTRFHSLQQKATFVPAFSRTVNFRSSTNYSYTCTFFKRIQWEQISGIRWQWGMPSQFLLPLYYTELSSILC